ncbi:ATP-grasp domain-containing protein [bacterium]|nr:ATP-grasp domain-containing protein [bacterium]
MVSTEKKKVLIMFGGVSPEHEVSVISGLQIVETIDRTRYSPVALFVSKKGEFHYLGDMKSRKEFLKKRRDSVTFGRDIKGGYIQLSGIFGQKIYVDIAYLAFHGGLGEGGAVQGMLEVMGVPFTSTGQEGSVITMNKQLTKEIVEKEGIKVVPSVCFSSCNMKEYHEKYAQEAVKKLKLPIIVKPVHLGSSIGIHVARTQTELEQYLLEASYLDTEILVEKFIPKFVEYNCSVRTVNGILEASEVERPIGKDEILSFADKYERGAKKTGGSGMASLDRELPAKIPAKERNRIQELAKKAYRACRCKGLVRIDFMCTPKGELCLTEINPIPGSLSFYLWEATGVTFRQQITDSLEQAVTDAQAKRSLEMDYSSDIVEKFVKS